MSAAAQWDTLHRDPRHRLEYPSEHVVRWVSGLKPGGMALDIGAGSGRHTRLLADKGFSPTALDAFGPYATPAAQADMVRLPLPANTFDVALSFGVFYYGTQDEHRQAVTEMYRVLRPGGHGFVCVRTHKDWRQRFTYNGVFHCHGEPEDGMPMHFLTEYEVRTWYAAFSELGLETTETTRNGRTRCDSDWLVTLVK